MSQEKVKPFFTQIPLQLEKLAQNRRSDGRLNFYIQLIELYSSFDILHQYFESYLLTSVTSQRRNFEKHKFTSTDGRIYSWADFFSPLSRIKSLLCKQIFYLFIDYHIPPSIPFWKGERDAYQKDGSLEEDIVELIEKVKESFSEMHLPSDFSFPKIKYTLKSETDYWIEILDESRLEGKKRRVVQKDYLRLVEERIVLFYSLVTYVLDRFEIPADLHKLIFNHL